MKMRYRDLQFAFRDFIQDKAPVNFAAEPISGMNIYKANYFSALADSLKNKFPVTTKYLQDDFKKLTYQYITLNPSSSYNLDLYGSNFPNFLRKQKLPLAYELAKLELQMFETMFSPY